MIGPGSDKIVFGNNRKGKRKGYLASKLHLAIKVNFIYFQWSTTQFHLYFIHITLNKTHLVWDVWFCQLLPRKIFLALSLALSPSCELEHYIDWSSRPLKPAAVCKRPSRPELETVSNKQQALDKADFEGWTVVGMDGT